MCYVMLVLSDGDGDGERNGNLQCGVWCRVCPGEAECCLDVVSL